MLDLQTEQGLVMAVITELRQSCDKEFRVIGRMRIMAGAAPHAEGRMDILLRICSLIMTAVAELGRFRRKPFRGVVRLLMWYFTRVYRAVAGRTAHCDCRVDHFLLPEGLVANEAVLVLSTSDSGNQGKQQKNKRDKTPRNSFYLHQTPQQKVCVILFDSHKYIKQDFDRNESRPAAAVSYPAQPFSQRGRLR